MGSGAAKSKAKKAAIRAKQNSASPWVSSSSSTPKGKKGKPFSQSPRVHAQEQLSIRQRQQWSRNQSYANSPIGFTLAEEARNTEHHVIDWRTVRLRERPIRFVSGGLLNQKGPEAEDEEKEVENDTISVKNVDTFPDEQGLDDPVIAAGSSSQPFAAQDQAFEASNEEDDNEVEETVVQTTITEQVKALTLTGDVPVPEEQPVSTTRSRSETSSSSTSGGDVVVFRGRTKAEPKASTVATTIASTTNQQPSRSESPKKPQPEQPTLSKPQPIIPSNSTINKTTKSTKSLEKQTVVNTVISQTTVLPSHSEETEIKLKQSGKTKRKAKSEHMSFAELMIDGQISDEEEALMRDYIANMRDLTDSDAEDQPNGTFKDDSEDEDLNNDWDSADLEDLIDLSTSEDIPEEVAKILLSRERPSGVQYLVVGVDEDVDEARWITQEALNSRDAIDVLRAFEAKQEAKLAGLDVSDDESGSEDSEEAAFNDYMDDLESEQDENDEIDNRRARMTDEQIAQALAKQEELGMDADEVLLFGDGLIDDDTLNGFSTVQRSRKAINSASKGKAKKSRRSDQFPSAEAFADALDQDPYGAFDIMDFDRPSLKPKKKGRKSALPFELEDEELQMQLEQSWETDRRKKATRKQEREALRAQGLLGSKNGKPDMSAKYRNGMSTANIRSEIKAFLMSSEESLSLVSMDPNQRRQVHLLAHALKLKSKSHGTGANRYPVLAKTKFTPVFDLDYSESELEEILNSAQNPRQLYRSSNKGAFAKVKTTGKGKGRGGGGGGMASGAGYMDGDIVGASAPEIGIDNKGRAMLEKMGWIKGMGLGAGGNMGIVAPVQHVVKKTKAGLG